MGRKKKPGLGDMAAVGIIGMLALIAAIPKEAWIIVGIIGLVYFYVKHTRSKATDSLKIGSTNRKTAKTSASAMEAELIDDSPVIIMAAPASVTDSSFRIPSPPKGFGAASWIPRGQSIKVAGITIPGGMVYVGTSLKAPSGINDPCLIDPSKSVSSRGNFTEGQMGYWPSYSEISTTARRSYLNWLVDGRHDPEADIGYVFLFFYGLERRAIIDASGDMVAQLDWPIIAEEILRLLDIYGEKSNSFRHYASELLNWVSLADYPAKTYEKPIPAFPKTFELPIYVRLALGQAAIDGVPVPAHLALTWTKLEPSIFLRTPAKRCPEQFDKLFQIKYSDIFGSGFLLPRNRTKLKLVYRPASAGFRGYNEIKLTFGETPDVTALTAPLKKLQQIVEATTKELEPYSRYIGKNPEAKTSLEGLLQLPTLVWPEEVQKDLQLLKTRIGSDMVVMPFEELLSTLRANSTLTKDKVTSLCRVLESIGIGIEPDVISGAKLPKPTDNLVLFNMQSGEEVFQVTPAYQAALLTLQLASSVASADGEFCAGEISYLREEVQSWSHLTPSHHRRLLAHLCLLAAVPASLTSIKKKLELLDVSARETIAVFMVTVAQSDGTVAPDEVKMLEKVYRILGVEPKKVFSNIHAVTSRGKSASVMGTRIEETGFKLDSARIAALQQDTEKVSILLSNIFQEEATVAQQFPEAEAEAETEHDVVTESILGLDETHGALARILLSRPRWSREELLDVAADLDLMLDGALEHINEASFDTHDIPFTEGDDPIEVNAELLEKVEA